MKRTVEDHLRGEPESSVALPGSRTAEVARDRSRTVEKEAR